MPGVWVFPGGARRRATELPRATDDDAEAPPRVRERASWPRRPAIELDRRRRARPLVALDHPRAGSGPLRHPLLPRPRARPLPAEARRRGDHDAAWIDPAEALDRTRRDEIELVFPTIKHLESLAPYATADEAMDAGGATGVVEPIMPNVVPDESDARLARSLTARRRRGLPVADALGRLARGKGSRPACQGPGRRCGRRAPRPRGRRGVNSPAPASRAASYSSRVRSRRRQRK